MTPDDVRAAAEQLVEFHERFAPRFGEGQAQDHACDSLRGLMGWRTTHGPRSAHAGACPEKPTDAEAIVIHPGRRPALILGLLLIVSSFAPAPPDPAPDLSAMIEA